MTVAKIMSWNIKTLGPAKAVVKKSNPPAESELINFLYIAICKSQADVVGITEVRSQLGAKIGGWVCARLNAVRPMGAAYQWKWVVSAQQDGGTKEQYLVLWQDEANVLSLDGTATPSPAWLMGVVDDNALDPFFTSVGWTSLAQKDQAYAALAADGYIYKAPGKKKTNTWRVVPDQWRTLNAMVTPEVQFTSMTKQPPTVPSQAQRQDLAARLLAVDMLRFVSFADRSPFVVNFLLGAGQAKVSYALMHAPGPQDPTRVPAVNVLALSAPLQTAAASNALLIAGDFNISVIAMNNTARPYARIDKNGTFTFAEDTTSAPQRVFGPVTGAPLHATDLIPGQLTSISEKFIADGSSEQDALANAYDKMFFRSGGGIATVGLRRVINVMRWLASNQGQLVYYSTAAASALKFLRTYKPNQPFLKAEKKHKAAQSAAKKVLNKAQADWTAEMAKITKKTPPNSPIRRRAAQFAADMLAAQAIEKDASDELAALTAVVTLVGNPVNTACTGIGTALAVYRKVVSDHLPVIVNVSAP